MSTEDTVKLNIVAVDDDRAILSNLKASLNQFGYSVKTFNTPAGAIEWIKAHGADIVISDIIMPGQDGFAVLGAVKEYDPSCEVIFLSGHAFKDTAIRALREGAADFLEKPFDSSGLRAAVERTARFRLLQRQKAILTAQVSSLSRQIHGRADNGNVMLGQSDAMKRIAEEIVNVAQSRATALITGESGTGKELVAHAIHQAGERRSQPIIAVNCGSIPEELFESEMFGHRRGAFTGAVERQVGYVAAAEGGTLFLDEIGDLPLVSQPKILRLLEQRTYLPVGETREQQANVRVVAATNQPLEELVTDGRFRTDLFYRLSVCTVHLPPLRERRADIPLLALHFVLQLARELGKSIEGIDEAAMDELVSRDYPGNIRELRNLIEAAIIQCRHPGSLSVDDLPVRRSSPSVRPATDATSAWPFEDLSLDNAERLLYTEAMRRASGNVSGAARLVGLSRSKFRRRQAALGLD